LSPQRSANQRTVPVPVWLLVATAVLLLTLAGLGGASVVLLTDRDSPTPVGVQPVASMTPRAQATDSESPIPTPTQTLRATPSATPSPKASKARPVPPRGAVYVERPRDGGQGYGPSPQCAEWNLTLVNDSSREVTSLRWRVDSAEYTDYSGDFDPATETYPTKAAKTPSAQTLRLSVPAHTRQAFQVTSCTTTPWPGGGYQYDETTTQNYAITWTGGFDGYATWRR
jgi:hypothetical protein